MDFQRPLSVITATVDGDILGALARLSRGREGEGFSAASVARVAGTRSVNGIRKALDRLVSQGIVLEERIGGRVLFSLNVDHLAAPSIMALTNLRIAFGDLVAEELSRWEPAPIFAALLRPKLELLVVVREVLESLPPDITWITPELIHDQQLGQLRRRVRDATGNPLTVHEFTPGAAQERMQAGDQLLRSVADAGQVIVGESAYLRMLIFPRPERTRA